MATSVDIFAPLMGTGLLLGTLGLMRHYVHRKTSCMVILTVLVAWLLGFSFLVLLPIDLATHQAEREVLVPLWRTVYWTSFTLCWIVIPVGQCYVCSGEFSWRRKLRDSLVANLIFYLVSAVAMLAFVIYIAVSKQLNGEQIVGFIICLSNTAGLIMGVLLLGYGLVELPRQMWRKANRTVRLKRARYRVAVLHDDRTALKEDLQQIVNLLTRLNETLPPTLHPRLAVIKKALPCPDTVDMDHVVDHSRFEQLPIVLDFADVKGITEKKLVKLHVVVKNLTRSLRGNRADWEDVVNEGLHLEDLIKFRTGPPPSGPFRPSLTPSSRRGSTSFGNGAPKYSRLDTPAASCLSRGLWLTQVFVFPIAFRVMGVLLAVLSIFTVWCQATLLLPVTLSPLPLLLTAASGQAGSLTMFSLFLGFLSACTFWAAFRLRLGTFYRMFGQRRTDEYSLLLNGSLLLRLSPPLALNMLSLTEAKHTAFQGAIGEMKVIPFFGESFNIYFPVVIIVWCLFTLFNIWGRVLRCLQISQFQFHDAFDDDQITEGQAIIRRERAVRAQAAAAAEVSEVAMTTLAAPL